MRGKLYRLSAFSEQPDGGNPAGVWLGDALPDAAEMLRIAAEVGFSETAFVAPLAGSKRNVRYFSPLAEVSFCGHATIATGVVLGQRSGEGAYTLATAAGDVAVDVQCDGGRWQAALTSVTPSHAAPGPGLVAAALAALSWRPGDLDPHIPPAVAYAGASHLVLAASTQERLQQLDYDFDTLKALMLQHDLTTLQLLWRESATGFHARNPFPVGGVVEDPATGAASAALGGYLRDAGLVEAPVRLTIRQGEAMGRPSLIQVDISGEGGIVVSGTAVTL